MKMEINSLMGEKVDLINGIGKAWDASHFDDVEHSELNSYN